MRIDLGKGLWLTEDSGGTGTVERTGGGLTALSRYGPVSSSAEGMVYYRYRARHRHGQARAVGRFKRR